MMISLPTFPLPSEPFQFTYRTSRNAKQLITSHALLYKHALIQLTDCLDSCSTISVSQAACIAQDNEELSSGNPISLATVT